MILPLLHLHFPNIFHRIQKQNLPILFPLSLLASLYFFLVIIVAFFPGGIVEKEEFIIYVVGWALVPVFAIFAVYLYNGISEKYFQGECNPLWILLASNSLLFAIITTSLNLISKISNRGLFYFIIAAFLAVPLVNALVIFITKTFHLSFPVTLLQVVSLAGGLGILNFIGLVPYFNNQYHTSVYPFLLALLCGSAAAYITQHTFFEHKRSRFLFGLDIFILLLIILTCVDPAFSIDEWHQNFYLGPANRIAQGGTMLVDTFSQYGVLVIYFIALLAKNQLIPLSYQGLSFAVGLLVFVQYAIIYYCLISLVKSRFYSILLLVLALLLGVFGTLGFIQVYPSVGPLRFGLAYLVLCAVLVRNRYPQMREWILPLEYFLVGITSLWSFETFVYAAFPYLGICVYESFIGNPTFVQALKAFGKRLFGFVLALVITQLGFILFTYLRSGEMPNWIAYLEYLYAYSLGEYVTLPVDPWSPWFFLVIIYLVSLSIFLFRFVFERRVDDSPQSIFIWGLTLVGIATLTYYLGRSHPNNLYHIATPAVVIAGYWLIELFNASDLPNLFRQAASFVFYSTAFIILFALYPAFSTKVQENHTGFQLSARYLVSMLSGSSQELTEEQPFLQPATRTPRVADAVELVNQYTPGQKDATIFLYTTDITEILIRLNRVHRFPIGDVMEDAISDRISEMIVNYPHGLEENDVIFLFHDPMAYQDNREDLQVKIINKICQDFRFEELDNTPSGVGAFQLKSADGTSSDYCKLIKSIRLNGTN